MFYNCSIFTQGRCESLDKTSDCYINIETGIIFKKQYKDVSKKELVGCFVLNSSKHDVILHGNKQFSLDEIIKEEKNEHQGTIKNSRRNKHT